MHASYLKSSGRNHRNRFEICYRDQNRRKTKQKETKTTMKELIKNVSDM